MIDRSPDPAGLRDEAREHAGDVAAALAVAERLGAGLVDAGRSHPGVGGAGSLGEAGRIHRAITAALAALAAGDLTVARTVEPHLDALIILAEAGNPVPATGRWGVFAAEGPGSPLRAEPAGGGWLLAGSKPWCSLAGRLDHALVTAHAEDGRRLFAVDLHAGGVRVRDAAGWVAHGLPAVTSVPVEFDAVPATAVGDAGWYLDRPGFAWGAVRVAACWLGGAGAVLDYLGEKVRQRYATDPLRGYNLGRADVAHWSAELAVRHAATAIDDDYAMPAGPATRLAERTRAVVAEAVEVVLAQAGHALGPAPLAFDAGYAQRVADLTLYVRQHHAERDLSGHGRRLAAE